MSKFQTKIKKQYKDNGWMCIKVIRFSDAGWPDLMFIKRGEPNTWIEIKEPGDTLKDLQKYRIDELNKAGNVAFCLHAIEGKIYPV